MLKTGPKFQHPPSRSLPILKNKNRWNPSSYPASSQPTHPNPPYYEGSFYITVRILSREFLAMDSLLQCFFFFPLMEFGNLTLLQIPLSRFLGFSKKNASKTHRRWFILRNNLVFFVFFRNWFSSMRDGSFTEQIFNASWIYLTCIKGLSGILGQKRWVLNECISKDATHEHVLDIKPSN